MNPLIVVHDNFDVNAGCAYHSMRFGYYHGFENIGLRPQFVRHSDIAEVEDPVFLLTWDDYNYLSDETLETIRSQPKVVMVNPWFKGMESLPTLYHAPRLMISVDTIVRIIENEPTFVWGLDPEPYLMFYEKWEQHGCKVVSLPPACDTTRYYPSDEHGFEDVEVGFVGSYRTYKIPQYEDYLWPYEDKLKIWSHSPWPRNYQGKIAIEDTRILYRNAKVCPTISEPSLSVLWILPERPFAVLGSGGLTILDCVPTYRHLFDPDDVLMPDNLKQYHGMMDAMLHNDDFNRLCRGRGHMAIMEKHTFAHRAEKIIRELKL